MRDQKEFNEIMKRNFTKKEEQKIMTYAEQLRFEGKAEGKAETTRNVAIRLLQQNLNPRVIAKGTNLSLAKVLELKKKIAAG